MYCIANEENQKPLIKTLLHCATSGQKLHSVPLKLRCPEKFKKINEGKLEQNKAAVVMTNFFNYQV